MCLTLNEDNKSRIAEEDIIIYKRLKFREILTQKYHGKEFAGKINNELCKGKISI